MTRYFSENFRDTSTVAEQQDSEHIEGSGGCFVAGTLVHTLRGLKPIEKIKVGDVVLGYDRDMNLERGAVRAVHVHKKADQDSDIVTFTFDDDTTLTVTGNHGMFTGDEETPFVEAQSLEVGDTVYKIEGSEIVTRTITDKDVKLLRYKKKDFTVYNLTVHPQHTYIAGGILVHNGGGNKSGDSRTPVEGPNTLRSRAVVRVIEVISEGEIEGLVDEEQGVLFDDTPIISSGGQPNFENVSYVVNYGTPDQEYLPGFSEVEAEIGVGAEAKFNVPITRSVSANTDAIRAKLLLPAGLYEIDLETGDTNGNNVTIRWQRRFPSGSGVWETVTTDAIKGKQTSAYQRDYRIPEPEAAAGAAWDVRLVRVSADETSSTARSSTFFDSYTEIQELKLSYPDTAVIGVEVDAEATGGNIPVRSYDVYGIKVKVPTNYDPLTRAYNGVWDGSFKTEWTDNPAWVVYDLLTSVRYGLGEYLDENSIDKFAFYDAAVYNDELIPDGDAGTEPRYTFNGQLATQEDSWKMVQAIAASMRATVVAGSIITLVQDRPTTPTRLITNANVLEGNFNYMSTGLSTRKTVARVTFNDPNDRYLPKTVTEENATGISRYGFNTADVGIIGCTSEGQARRHAKWFLDTELNTPELVTFGGALEIADLNPGDVIKILDRDYAGVDAAGLVAGGTTTSITLDREVTIGAGTYTLSIADPKTNTIEERTVTTGAGTHTSLTVSPAFSIAGSDVAGLLSGWMLESDTNVVAREFRVVNKMEVERGKFEVTAAAYDNTKYARVETGISIPPPTFTNITTQSVNPVTGVDFQLESYVDPNFGGRVKLLVAWDKPDTYVTKYSVQWRRNNGEFSAPRYVTQAALEIDPITPGDYEVMIVAYNVRGVKSVPYLETFTYAPGTINTMSPPINLRVPPETQGGNSFEFTTQDLTVYFDVNPANDAVGDIGVFGGIAGYKVVWKDSLDNVLDTVYLAQTPNLDASTFTVNFPFATNVATPGGPHREVKVDIYTLTTDGAASPTALSGTLTNPVPGPPGVSILNQPEGAFVQAIAQSDDKDVAGMVITSKATAGDYTPVLGDVVYSGTDLSTQIAYPGPFDSRSIKVALFDNFSNDFADLQFSTFNVQEASPYGITPVTALPTLPSVNFPRGVVVYLTADETLYRVSADGLTWTNATDGSTINPRSITADRIVAGDISAAEIGANSITVGNAALANAVVTTAKIDDLAVSTAKIQDLSVDTIKIANDAASNVSAIEVGGSTSTQFSQPISDTWKNLMSTSINVDSDGRGLVIITFAIDATAAANTPGAGLTLIARVQRATGPNVTIWEGLSTSGQGGDEFTPQFAQIKGSFTITDEPPPGTMQYLVQLKAAPGIGSFYYNTSTLTLLEAKK